jgi:RNA polymerase sigma-70 factor (ECF subfamily)
VGLDPQRVRHAQGGDQVAFGQLVEAELDRLYAMAVLVLHDPTLAEDAVQETLVRAWRSLPRLRDPDLFEAWLRRVCVHACIDAARAERHRRTERELPLEMPGAADLETMTAERDSVTRAFLTLSCAHRAAFVLRHYYGHSVAEVADALHVPLGTAKSRIHYAEQAMARAMDADAAWATVGGAA